MNNTRAEKLLLSEEVEVAEDFVSGYEGMVKRIVADSVREIGDFTLSFDDLYQEGMIALYHATKKYKDTGNATFMTYAYKAVKNRVIKEVKHYSTIYTNECYSYDVDPRKYEKLFTSDDEFDYSPLINEFINRLNKNDQMIFKLYLQGRSYAEIAVMTNTSSKKIDNRLCLIRKKLNDYYKSI